VFRSQLITASLNFPRRDQDHVLTDIIPGRRGGGCLLSRNGRGDGYRDQQSR